MEHTNFHLLPTENIYPHPQNPRRDLGDLSELAESIKAQGIMQNLTVVPCGAFEYTVVIGHRRLAAARLAGLETVPCAIAKDMDEKAQIAAMLLENIQRADLLDLGDSIKDVSEKTGFSRSTVSRRINMIKKLNREILEQKQCDNITLDDYERLYEIEDDDKRNEVFEQIGTTNFEWCLKSVLNEQQSAKTRKEIIDVLSGFATPVDEEFRRSANITWGIDLWRATEDTLIKAREIAAELDDDKEYYFYDDGRYTLLVFAKDGELADVKKKRKDDSEEKEVRKKRIQELFRQAYALRLDFARRLGAFSAPKAAIVGQMAIDALFGSYSISDEVMRAMFDIKDEFRQPYAPKSKGETRDEAVKRLLDAAAAENVDPVKLQFIGSYIRFDSSSANCVSWQGDYNRSERLERLYGWLEKFGYKMSSEEKTLLDGTHELFAKDDEEE
jgi:ParB family chromosome partitioning protein